MAAIVEAIFVHGSFKHDTGLDPESVEEVFDPFLAEGTEAAPGGDELRTAARIVTEHGGALQLRPDAQVGTHASFVLPVSEPS